jgi:hypothetical protein
MNTEPSPPHPPSEKSSNNGVLRSAPRLFMLVVSTLTFALGLIALVLETSLAFQDFARELGSSSSSLWSTHRTNIVVALCATITYLVVSVPNVTFTFMMYNLMMCPPLVFTHRPSLCVESGRAVEL